LIDRTCFDVAVNHPNLRPLFAGFCIYHINAPGQQDNATKFDSSFHFPSIEQLAQQIVEIVDHFK
jgi:hypothetical protein